ncbi:MAG: response regulator [candidate division Zixibacteria bacterium]|nr:response regulator [candidate division Zixibacteria bacterium]
MSKKILVADDSLTIRKLAESLLKKQGYEVLCAEDGADALGMAKTNKPDLIFWDDSLPILDGHSVCEELKGNDELKDIPVIIFLTKEQAEKEQELVRVGADAFLVKPFNPKDILEKVQEFLNRENTNFKDKMQKGPRDELVCAEEKSGIDKTEKGSTLSKEEEKTDESLDILETSEFVESLETPSSGSDVKKPHGFDWFMSEMKKEMEETKQVDLGVEQKLEAEIISTEITSFDREELKKKDKDGKDVNVYEIDKDQKGYEDVEKSSDQKIPSLNYDKMIQQLIETISTKIAQEVAKKIDPEILRKTLRDEVEKLRKEGMKAD